MRKGFLLVWIFAACCGFAADVVFTGAGTNPLDLAEAANWSEAPGSGVRGVIDFKRISTTSNFVLGADLELKQFILSNNVAGVVTIDSANGSKISMPAGSYIYNTGKSPLLIQSGTIASASGLGIAEGYVEVAGGALSAVNGEFTTPTEGKAERSTIGLAISSGSVSAVNMRPGVRSPHYKNVSPDIRQTGGTVAVSGNLEVGRNRLSGIANNGSNPGDYRLEGGTLAASKLVLARQDNVLSAQNDRFGRYLQTGGTAEFGTVSFGSAVADLRSFGQFDLFGGMLNLGAGGFAAGSNFDSTLGYRFRQAGGTVKATADSAVDFAYDIDCGDTASTWNTDGHDVAFKGPVRGNGALVKSGEGTLTLTDASQFKGSLSVQGGTVLVIGAASEPVISGYKKYLRFTAADIDSAAAAGQCDGTALTNWVSTTGTGAATYTGWAQTNSKPTVVTDGGRRWVYFDKSALEIPTAQNPVAGETNFLVALVFKTSTPGLGAGSGWWNMPGVLGNEQSGYPADWGLAFGSTGKFTAGGGGLVNSADQETSLWLETANTSSLADGNTHVLLLAYSGYTMQMLVDGIYADKTLTEKLIKPVAARQSLPCYVGAHNPTAAKFKSYSWQKGYMAELRIYGGKTFTRGEMEALGRYLGERYQTPARNWNVAYAQSATVDRAFDAPTAAPVAPVHSADWSADTLAATLADGASVEDWPSVDGTRHATMNAATICYWRPEDQVKMGGSEKPADSPVSPVLVLDAVNGHAALRFGGDNSHRTLLGVPAADSPISGATNYTVAAVIQTTAEPQNASSWANDGQWMTTFISTANGLRNNYNAYDCCNTNSFLLGLIPGGGVHATTAQRAALAYDRCYPSGPMRLNDGRPHCIVFAHDRKTGERRVMIDGYLQLVTNGTKFNDSEVMLGQRVLLGAVDAANKFWAADYNGYLAAFRLYGEALDDAGMKALSDGWCAKYGILPVDNRSYAATSPERSGFGVTNVTVASGAVLSLPMAATTPFTVTAGELFSCAGSWQGTVRFGSGAVADFAAAKPVSAGEARFAAGSRMTFDLSGGAIAAERVVFEGDTEIDFVSAGAIPRTGSVFATEAGVEIAPGATIRVAGTGSVTCEVSADGKSLEFHRHRGVQMIFR